MKQIWERLRWNRFVWAVLIIVAIIIDDIIKFYFFKGSRPHYHIGKHCVRLCPIKLK